MIIAIDGHSSCGKSTLAKELAQHYDYIYVDTGAMYRAVTYFFMSQNCTKEQSAQKEMLENINLEFKTVFKDQKHIFLNGLDIEKEIRSMEVANKVSEFSQLRFVREEMVCLQRKMGKKGNLILDGRDIGTVVFPNADLKIFLTAKSEVRAQRRFKEMQDKGVEVTFQEVLDNVVQRDYQDENREESPLKKAKDAVLIDNSYLSKEEQFDKVVALVDALRR